MVGVGLVHWESQAFKPKEVALLASWSTSHAHPHLSAHCPAGSPRTWDSLPGAEKVLITVTTGRNGGYFSCILGPKECSLSVELKPAPRSTLVWVPVD